MGKTIYANLSATSFHYLVMDYLLGLKDIYEEGDTAIICFWDYDVYNFSSLDKNHQGDRKKIRDITNKVSSFLSGLDINHKIIYLSDGIKRLNTREELYDILLHCYNHLTIGQLEDSYKKNNHLKIKHATIGKINFMVSDYLIALFFRELFPRVLTANKINIYYTGERFISVKEKIQKAISKKQILLDFPSVRYWKALPVLNYASGNWFSLSMSRTEIEDIIYNSFPKNKAHLSDLVSMGLKINNPVLNHKINNYLEERHNLEDKRVISQEVSAIMKCFFDEIKKIVESKEEGTINKVTYVNTSDQLKNLLKTFNPSKFEILRFCNGINTIEDIIKLVPMKESSIRSYLSILKKEKLTTSSKRPQRLIDEISINF